MSECDGCLELIKKLEGLKHDLANHLKQYAEDRLKDGEDLKGLEDDLDSLLEAQTARHAIAEFLGSAWKFILGLAALVGTIAGLTWTITRMLG